MLVQDQVMFEEWAILVQLELLIRLTRLSWTPLFERVILRARKLADSEAFN